MAVHRRFHVSSVIAACGGILFLVWLAWPAVAPKESPDPRTRESAPASKRDARAAESNAANSKAANSGAAPAVLRSAAPAARDGESEQQLRVRVVERGSGASVAGAKVLSLSLARPLPPEAGASHDLEQKLERFGNSAVTDASGQTTLPVLPGVVQLAARHGNLYGASILMTSELRAKDGYAIEIAPDRSLALTVVDAAGRPVEGIAIADARRRDGAPWIASLPRGRTDRDGRFELRHLQALFPTRTQGPAERYRVVLHEPGLLHVGADFDPQSPPSEPLRIVLPATGRLVVVAMDSRRQPIPRARVRLAAARPEPDAEGARRILAAGWSGETLDDGTCVWPRIGCGVSFEVLLDHGNRPRASVEGPRHAHEDARVELIAGEVVALVGRLVDERGMPLDASTRVAFALGERSHSRTMPADPRGGGRFRIELPGVAGAELTRLRVDILDAEQQPSGRVADVALARRLEPGDNELGAVVVRSQSPWLRGKVLEDGDAPAEPVTLIVERLENPRPAAESWAPEDLLRPPVAIAKDGTFAVFGNPGGGQLRLSVHSTVHVPVEPIAITSGVRDLVVHLTRGGSLRALVLVDPSIPADDKSFSVVLVGPQTDSLPEPRSWPGHVVALKGDKDRTFQWTQLPAGRYRLEVRLLGRIAQTINDVQIVAGRSNEDPRLRPIDLRQSVRQLRIELRDEAGAAITGGGGIVLLGGSKPHVLRARAGAVFVPTGPEPIDFLAVAPGFQVRVLRDVRADTAVELERCIEVVLRVRGLPEIANGTWSLGLRGRDPDGSSLDLRAWAALPLISDWATSYSVPLVTNLGPPSVRVHAAGVYRVALTMRQGRSTRSFQLAPAILVVQPTPKSQAFDLEVGEERLRRR